MPFSKEINIPEEPICEWQNIAAYFNISVASMVAKHRKELLAGGWVFYIKKGRPGKRYICAWPSQLKRWAAIKTAKGEVI